LSRRGWRFLFTPALVAARLRRTDGHSMNTVTSIPDMTPTPSSRSRFGMVFVVVVVAVNLLALGAAWQDRSWGALMIAVVVGPALNGVLALVGLAATPFLRRRRSPFPVRRHVAFSLGVPIAAIVIDFFAIASMGVHGG
jgi:hypothetical protein